jgi:hypothetical protein
MMSRTERISRILEEIIRERYRIENPDKEIDELEMKRWWSRHVMSLIHVDIYTILLEMFKHLNREITPEDLWVLTQHIFNEMIFLPPHYPYHSFISVSTAYVQRYNDEKLNEKINLRDKEFLYDRLKHIPVSMIEDMISVKENMAWLDYAIRFPDRHLFLMKVRAIPLIGEEKKERLIGLIFEGKLGPAVKFLSKISGKSRVHIPTVEYSPKEIKKALRQDQRRRKRQAKGEQEEM